MIENDTHTTDGFHYRTPAHPLMIAALGRAMWNFISLEEEAVAILAEVGTTTLGAARKLQAGEKESWLRRTLKELRDLGASQELLDSLKLGIDEFGIVRSHYRNGLAHAGLFTVGYEADGTYLPGMSLDPKGADKLIISEASELHALAEEIEDSGSGLGKARRAIIEFLKGEQSP